MWSSSIRSSTHGPEFAKASAIWDSTVFGSGAWKGDIAAALGAGLIFKAFGERFRFNGVCDEFGSIEVANALDAGSVLVDGTCPTTTCKFSLLMWRN
jgi:hypothetical protein